MQSNYLGLLGLAKRAGKLEVGDEAARASINAKISRLVLIASDSSSRTCETFEFIAENANVAYIHVAETREELGNALGRRPCAIVSVCDVGFAEAIVKKLSETNEEAKAALDELSRRVAKISARRNKGKKKK